MNRRKLLFLSGLILLLILLPRVFQAAYTRHILVMAVRLGEVNHVHPVPRPTLSVMRTRQKPINDFFIGVR